MRWLPRLAAFGGAAVMATVFVACVGDDPSAPAAGVDAGSPAGEDGSAAGAGDDAAGDAPVGPSCDAPKVTCGAACVDPASFAGDAKSCGACGHDCLGGTCVAGKCQPATLLTPPVSGGEAIAAVAVDANTIYFASPPGTVGAAHGAIRSCPLTGCVTAATLLYDASGADAEVDALLTTTAAPDYLYYSDNGHGHVFRIVKNGTASPGVYPGVGGCQTQPTHCAVDVLASAAGPNPLATDGTNLYTYTDNGGAGSGGALARLPDGASGNVFGSGGIEPVQIGALALALDPSDATHRWLYVAGEKGIYAVQTSTAMTIPSSLDDDDSAVAGVAVGSQTVFFTRSDGVHAVGACNASGCNPGASMFAPATSAAAIVTDATNVYFTASGHLYACPLTGCPSGTPTPIAALADRARALTEDATALYWGDDKGGLYRLAK